jgi:hypothetical protein
VKINSLLLGSAVVLAAASGARAADAIDVVAEPEPMEYVRVCDTYGEGFYYIPGTETCLRVGGYVRYDIGIGSLGWQDVIDKKDSVAGILNINDTYYKRARAALEVDARSETELGTLRGYFQINYDFDAVKVDIDDLDGDGDVDGVTTTELSLDMEHAYIELGGFRIGKTDSLFSTFTDYAGAVINDDLVPYGPFGTHQIVYTFNASNGVTAAVGLEEGDDVYTIDSYLPHIVAGVGYTAGWGGVSVVGGYDSVWEEFAVRGRVDVKASEAISLFAMVGYGTDDNAAFSFYKTWGGNWALWAGGTAALSDKAALNVQVGYDDDDNFAAVANVEYTLVPNLIITPEVVYTDNFDLEGDDEVGGFLRFQRSF